MSLGTFKNQQDMQSTNITRNWNIQIDTQMKVLTVNVYRVYVDNSVIIITGSRKHRHDKDMDDTEEGHTED